jgi:hypothetical protein
MLEYDQSTLRDSLWATLDAYCLSAKEREEWIQRSEHQDTDFPEAYQELIDKFSQAIAAHHKTYVVKNGFMAIPWKELEGEILSLVRKNHLAAAKITLISLDDWVWTGFRIGHLHVIYWLGLLVIGMAIGLVARAVGCM